MFGFSNRCCGLICLASILSKASAQNDSTLHEITTTTAGGWLQDQNDSTLHEITTTTAGGWLQDGVMFDVEVTAGNESSSNADVPDGITITGMNFLTPAEEKVCLEIYSKSGSHEGFEKDSAAWTFLGSVSVLGQGRDTLTPIPVGSFDVGDGTFVPVGERRSFYVTTQDQSMRYTAYPDGSHTTGSLFTSQAVPLDITSVDRSIASVLNVNVYTGVAKDYAFGATWKDRMFNGNLLYTLGREITNVPFDLEARTASRGKVTCDNTIAPSATPTTKVLTPEAPTMNDSKLKALATVLAGGYLQSGNMFDISVPSVEEGGPEGGVTVISMEMSTTSTDDICVEVYSKQGTHVGFEDDASAWTMLGATTTTGQGATEATRIPLGSFDPVHIGPGESRAFFVVTPEPVLRYTRPARGEVTGDVFASNNELQIHVGSVNAFGFGGYQSDRIWNGAIIYALGVQEDGKYSELTASERPRSCLAHGAEDAVADSDAAKDIDGTTNVALNTDETLTGFCDAADTSAVGDSKKIVLNYRYTLVTGTIDSASDVVSRMEEEIHDVLLIDKCYVGNAPERKLRDLQEDATLTFIGFKSSPKDVISDESCPDTTTISERNVCSLIQGGVTAVVPNDLNETEVKESMLTVLQQVLSNDGIAIDVGAIGVAFVSSEVEDVVIGDSVAAASPASSNIEEAEGNPTLSITQIIIVAAVGGGILLVAVLGVVLVRRKRRRAVNEEALFDEFPPEGYGDIQNLALGKSDDPLDDTPGHPSWGSSEGIETRKFAWQDASLVFNGQDEISAISNDMSRYSPSAVFPPTSGNSSVSRPSSKRNVEFVRAGRSFASNRSSQPDDTVDL